MLIRIHGRELSLTEPFEAGHPLTADEARALNLARASRIRKNLEHFLEAKGAPADLPAKAAELDGAFQFAFREPRSGGATLEDEIRQVARERAEASLREAGVEPTPIAIANRASVLLADPTFKSDLAREAHTRHEIRLAAARREIEALL